jgi:hypothetical protein
MRKGKFSSRERIIRQQSLFSPICISFSSRHMCIVQRANSRAHKLHLHFRPRSQRPWDQEPRLSARSPEPRRPLHLRGGRLLCRHARICEVRLAVVREPLRRLQGLCQVVPSCFQGHGINFPLHARTVDWVSNVIKGLIWLVDFLLAGWLAGYFVAAKTCKDICSRL